MKKKNHIKMRFSTLLLCCLAIMLCAAPALLADETVQPGDPCNIDFEVKGFLWVYGTANLLTGASVTQSIYVQNGGTLNMYSGIVGLFISVSPTARMTVYGTDFAVSNGTIDPEGNWIPDPLVGSVTLTGDYGDTSPINLLILSSKPISLQPPPSGGLEEITIDIKPGGNPNNINLKSNGVVPVAVLTTDGTDGTDVFDAGDVDPDTVEFAGTKPIRWKLCDVDGDGDLDRLFHFDTQELFENDLNEDSTKATLTGKTKDEVEISGTDTVCIKPQKKKK